MFLGGRNTMTNHVVVYFKRSWEYLLGSQNYVFYVILDLWDHDLRDMEKHVFPKNMTFRFLAIDEKNVLVTSKKTKNSLDPNFDAKTT